jgi:hypothetical protein
MDTKAPLLVLLCATVVTAQDSRREVVPDHPLLVHVVDDTTGEPVEGAEVLAVSREESVNDWKKRNWIVGDQACWEEMRNRIAHRYRTNAAGVANVTRLPSGIYLGAQHLDRWAQATVESDFEGQFELRLAPDRTFDVPVVDELGRPVVGVPVSLRSLDARSEPDSSGALDISIATTCTNAKGIAHFVHAQVLSSASTARLAIPLAKEMTVAIDPSIRLQSVLTLPASGRMVFLCPDQEGGFVRIRRARSANQGAIWFSMEPWYMPIAQGRAEFSHVGLDVEVDYEIALTAMEERIRGTTPGPTSSGETLTFNCPRNAEFPTLVGRLVNEDLEPIAGKQVCVTVSIEIRNGGSSRGTHLDTDERGRFRFVLRTRHPGEGSRRLVSFGLEKTSTQDLDFPAETASGVHDLGDLLLIAPGSTKWLERKSDDELEAEYNKTRRFETHVYYREQETCLTEIARRGGARWEAFLTAELEAARLPPEGGKGGFIPEDLELLTALRRARHQPDPLALEILSEEEISCVFPSPPRVAMQLMNVDRESFGFTSSRGFRSGRFEGCWVEAIDATGVRAKPLQSPGMIGGGSSSRRLLPAGKGADRIGLELPQYVLLAHPGSYRVRILYSDRNDIAGEDSIGGWILLSSPAFTVRIEPLKVRASREGVQRMREWIAALNPDKKIPLVSGHWHPKLEFQGEAQTPEDHLFRSGWPAVAVMLDALSNMELAPRRRAWVLGMLWNITGLNNPTGQEFQHALGAAEWITTWPTSVEEGQPTLAEAFDFGGDLLETQDLMRLNETWLALRPMVELEVQD